jgi:hypothetical protein
VNLLNIYSRSSILKENILNFIFISIKIWASLCFFYQIHIFHKSPIFLFSLIFVYLKCIWVDYYYLIESKDKPIFFINLFDSEMKEGKS